MFAPSFRLLILIGTVILVLVLVFPGLSTANLTVGRSTPTPTVISSATSIADTANPYADPNSMPEGSVATRDTDVMFVQNIGQFDSEVRFQIRGSNGIIWLTENSIWITIFWPGAQDQREGLDEPDGLTQMSARGVNIRLGFVGAHATPRIEPFERLDTMVNYALPADPLDWHADRLAWSGLTYYDLYPDVSLTIEAAALDRPGGSPQGMPLRWRLVTMNSSADPKLSFQITGASNARVIGEFIHFSLGESQFNLRLPSTTFPYSVELLSANGIEMISEVSPTPAGAVDNQSSQNDSIDLFTYLFSFKSSEVGRNLGTLDFPRQPGEFELFSADPEQGGGLPPGSALNLASGFEDDDDSTVFPQESTAFTRGDLFVAIGSGRVQWRRSDGSLISTLTTAGTGYTTGMMVNRNSNKLYVTNFSSDRVSVFDPNGSLLGTYGNGYYSHPESILFDASGNAYVGQADGYKDILKFNPSGSLIRQFDVGTHWRGSDWIELAADQCTMYYTSESYTIKRFNVCTNSQYTDFTSGLHGYAYALRLLPTGGLLVADTADIHRLNSSGAIIRTYDASGENNWFALNIAPNGTSFWSADLTTADVFRFDIETGAQIMAFDAGYGTSVGGLAVVGEVTVEYHPRVIAPIDNPRSGGTVGSQVTISGYAIDRNSGTGTGIDQVHIYLDGPYGTGSIIGAAQYGLSRPDVGNFYGDQRFTPSGWQLVWNTANVSPGAHSLYLYAHRTTDNRWSLFGPHNITVVGLPTPTPTVTPTPTYAPNVIAPIETPQDGAAVAGSATILGYAIDRNSRTGTGINAVHLYLDGPYGTGTFLGQAEYGLSRPDIGTRYGNARFTPSGWRFVWNVGNLSYGTHRLYLYARRSTDGQWAMRGPHNVVIASPTPAPPCERYEPNNTLGTATGPLANGQTMEAALCAADPDDFYFIELSGSATLTLDLNNLPAGTDYDLFLYASTGGNPIAQSRNDGVIPERIVKAITAGRYYIRVYPYSGRSNQAYRLRVVWGAASAVETESYDSGKSPVPFD